MDITKKIEQRLGEEKSLDEAKTVATDITWDKNAGAIKVYISPDTRDKDQIDKMVQKLAKFTKAKIMSYKL